jgi:hypothetical protein
MSLTEKPDDPGIGGGGDPPPPIFPPPPPPPETSAFLPAVVASLLRNGGTLSLLRIPLISTPSQSFAVQLGQQPCQIDVFQKRTGLFLNLYVNNAPIILGTLCRDRVWMVRDAYLGFTGDLAFIDTQGVDDPDYTGLADRFQLLWGS